MPTNRTRRTRAQGSSLTKYEQWQLTDPLLAMPDPLSDDQLRELWRIHGKRLLLNHECEESLEKFGASWQYATTERITIVAPQGTKT